jgi:hypothetical protein
MEARLFLDINWLGHDYDHPPPTDTEVKETVELYLYSPSVFMACYRVNINFTIHEYIHVYDLECKPLNVYQSQKKVCTRQSTHLCPVNSVTSYGF